MSRSERTPTTVRARREPPRFRRVAVRRVEHLSPRMVRVTLAGADLEGLTVEQPAASVRLLLPPPGTPEVFVPSWNGNEFLLPDGRRPTIRTFTPRRVDPEALELDVEIVIHGGGTPRTQSPTSTGHGGLEGGVLRRPAGRPRELRVRPGEATTADSPRRGARRAGTTSALGARSADPVDYRTP